MATNYIQPGEVWDYTAGADIDSGDVVLMSDVVGVALADIANGATGPVQVSGVFRITKLTADTPAQGAPLYWDAGNSRLTTTASTHKLAGYAAKAATSSDTTVLCKLKL